MKNPNLCEKKQIQNTFESFEQKVAQILDKKWSKRIKIKARACSQIHTKIFYHMFLRNAFFYKSTYHTMSRWVARRSPIYHWIIRSITLKLSLIIFVCKTRYIYDRYENFYNCVLYSTLNRNKMCSLTKWLG